jgi:hypothetical protein
VPAATETGPSHAPGRARRGPSRGALNDAAGPITFTRLKWVSYTHSCVYTALLVSAFAAGKPEPLTFALGLAHGLLWIFMSLACILAARLRVVPVRLAVAVAVLGGIGPFFGSYEFAREQRRRATKV